MNDSNMFDNSIGKCEELFDSLQRHLSGLSQLKFNNQAYLADIAAVGKSQENTFNQGLHKLSVNHYTNEEAILPLLQSYAELMRRTAKSSLFAKRFAGFIVVDENHPCLSLIQKINTIKDEIADCVRDIRKADDGSVVCDAAGKPIHHRNHQQKHDFIHKAIPNVITAQCYRHIPVIRNDVRRVSFYWATKHVHKTLSYEKTMQHIKYYLDFMGLNERLKPTLSELDRASHMRLYLPRLQTNSVMATFNFKDGTRKNVHCTVPVFIACNNQTHIKYKPLADHEPTPNKYMPPSDAKLICSVSNVYARP